MNRLNVVMLCFVASSGCDEKAKSTPVVQESRKPATLVVTDSSNELLFQFVAADGTSKEVSRVADVPPENRQRVRVIPMNGAMPPAGSAFVADLTKAGAGGAYAVSVVSLAAFAGIGREGTRTSTSTGTSTGATTKTNEGEGGIIMYATSWCGVCEKARSYFRRRKIEFVEKDIEKDAAAAAEMQRKAAEQGVSARGVPVIDIRGKLLAGFDPQTIERFLAR